MVNSTMILVRISINRSNRLSKNQNMNLALFRDQIGHCLMLSGFLVLSKTYYNLKVKTCSKCESWLCMQLGSNLAFFQCGYTMCFRYLCGFC